MNLAISITLSRVFLLPIVIYLICQEDLISSFLALVLFTIIVLSDYFDGYFARKQNKITKVGSFLDPFADKLVGAGILLTFYFQGSFWLIPLLIFILRDIIVNYIRFLATKYEIDLSRDVYGKLNTSSHFLLIYLLIIQEFINYGNFQNNFFITPILYICTFLAVLLALFSLSHYFYIFKKNKRRRINGNNLKDQSFSILANRKSRGYKERYRRRLLRKFSKNRKSKITYLPKRGDIFSNVDFKADNIIIAGGDGSFDSALNNSSFYNKKIGFFPLGAGNAYYSYFYRGKKFEYLRSVFSFKHALMDVLELEWEKGKYQTLFASLGVDAEVISLVKERTQNGVVDYFSAIFKGIVRAKSSYNFNIVCDGERKSFHNCINITLGKIPYYGYGVRAMLSPIKHKDGYVYGLGVVNRHNPIFNKSLRIWSFILISLGLGKPPLMPIKGKVIKIRSSEPFPIQAGGDFLGHTKWLKIKVKRQQAILII